MKRAIHPLAAVIFACLPTTAWAQITGGHIYGQVSDESGAALPGAAVVLSGVTIGGLSTTSGNEGAFRFLNLDPGTYDVRVSLKGFATVSRKVIVTTGVSLDLAFTLRLAEIEETVTVTAATPLVDSKKVGTSTTLSSDEISKIPSPRDPWAILRTVPGVLVARVNIAGSQSDQQMAFTGKGSTFADSMFILDGVNITDVGGGSPSYYDQDAFEEMAVTTGGNDLRVQTGGIGINFVTKRGTNSLHGSVRGLFTHDDVQWSNLPDELRTDPRLRRPDGTRSEKADHIRQIADFGAEAGGPIVKDKLWLWGSYGRQDIRLVRLNQSPDKTLLTNYSAKLNWQAGSKDMVSAFYFLGKKEKFARKTGIPVDEPDSFLIDQGPAYPNGAPHGLYKIEDNHVFGPNLFLNAKYAFYGWGASLRPRGGVDKDGGVDFYRGVAYGSSQTARGNRPWHNANFDASYFKAALGGNHEFRFGFGYRRAPIHSTTAYSGSKVFAYKYTAEGGYALVTRDLVVSVLSQYWNGYVGDTWARKRLTMKAGLRFDRQTAGAKPSSAQANPAFPELLPALDFDGRGQGIRWRDLSPRVGITYALDPNRRTILRASYARYAGQLSGYDATYDSPLGGNSYLAYRWVDLNGDGLAQKNEVLVEEGVQYSEFVDPKDPGGIFPSPNRIDPGYRANHDNEVILGIDRELAPNFAISAAYTFRRSADIVEWTPRIGLTRSDYTANPPVGANGFTAVSFSPDAAKVDASRGGSILTNRPDYSRSYNGFELSLMRRLSNKWMARAAFAYMDWRENYEGPGAIQNPTRTEISSGGQAGPGVDGGPVGGITARWQVIGNALYQLPAGFEVAGGLFARQGYPNPTILRLSAGLDGTLRVLATPAVTDNRLPSVWNLDLRLAKRLTIAGASALVVSADLFNAFNSSVALKRDSAANTLSFGRLNEVINPRIGRFGLRFTF